MDISESNCHPFSLPHSTAVGDGNICNQSSMLKSMHISHVTYHCSRSIRVVMFALSLFLYPTAIPRCSSSGLPSTRIIASRRPQLTVTVCTNYRNFPSFPSPRVFKYVSAVINQPCSSRSTLSGSGNGSRPRYDDDDASIVFCLYSAIG